MEEKVEDIEEKLESAKEQPKAMEEEKTESQEGTSENTEKASESAEGTSESVDEVSQNVEDVSESTEKARKNTEEATADTEERRETVKAASENTEAAALSKADDKEKQEKGRRIRKRIAGYAELAAAFFLIAISGWLFLNTRGTRLLYVSVTTGRVSRFYWIFLIAALIFCVIGLVTLKKLRADKEKDSGKK